MRNFPAESVVAERAVPVTVTTAPTSGLTGPCMLSMARPTTPEK
jgi:hypothetical protein